MSEFRLDLTPVAQDLVEQLKDRVPVRTGRLKKSISYIIEETGDNYVIALQMEDYFKWLKDREQPVRLPSPKELSMASPPLPKMNVLGLVGKTDLSSRSKRIIEGLNIERAMGKLDLTLLEENIKEVIDL